MGPLWTGTAEASWVVVDDGATARLVTIVDPVRLREHRDPLLVPSADGRSIERIGTYLDLLPEGTVLTTQSSIIFTGPEACSQSGSGTVTVLPDEGRVAIYIKTEDVDATPGAGWNVPLGPGRYVGSFLPDRQRVTYDISGCGDSREEAYWALGFGKNPMMPDMPGTFSDPQPRYLQAGGGRMSGSYSGTLDGDGILEVSWNICREGVSCAGPPVPEETSAPTMPPR